MKNFNRFLENVVYINNSIKVLLNEDGIISPPPDLDTVNEKFTVIEDGKEPKDNEITLKNAKKFKTDAVIGDVIDVPVISFEGDDDSVIEEKFREMISDGDINWKDVEQMALAGSSGKVRRTAVGAIKVTPKVLAASGRLMLLGKLKKDIPHSQCYCVKLFDGNLDSTVTPPKPSRDVYKDSLSDYLDSVVDEFLEGWDECEKKYDNLIDDKAEREKALDACPAIEDYFKNAEALLNKILGDLGKFFNVEGIEVEKKTLAKGSKSIAKKIGLHSKIEIHFTKDVQKHDGSGVLFADRSDRIFDIGTYKEDGNVVKIIDGRKIYYMEFSNSERKKEQKGSLYNDVSGKPGPNPVSWKGYIIKFI
jgi:hypothetical protein